MIELLDLELDTARRRMSEAEHALETAREMLAKDHGVAVGLALCCRISAAQQRVGETRTSLAVIEAQAQHWS